MSEPEGSGGWHGAPACPQCASTSHEEDPMPKIHKDRPPTYEPVESRPRPRGRKGKA